MSKLLPNRPGKLARKKPQIGAKNLPKLPELALFEPRKKSIKRIAIAKFPSSRLK